MHFNFDDLVASRLVNRRDYQDLRLFKYHKKVFWRNLWNTDSRLLEARGVVLDQNGLVVSRPFKKVFNYGENNTRIADNRLVSLIPKINGFMCAMSWHEDRWDRDNGFVITSTGSFDSEYVEMAKKHLNTVTNQNMSTFTNFRSLTHLFEIVDENDPHVVPEEVGAHYLATRGNETGDLYWIEDVAKLFHSINPRRCVSGEWFELQDYINGDKTEGFMVVDYKKYSVNGVMDHLCKVKTPYYLSTKFLMRGSSKIFHPDVKKVVAEEFYDIVDDLKSLYTEEEWNNLTEQGRRSVVQNYFTMR